MILPKASSTTSKFKNSADPLSWGIRDLTVFCKTLNALWILGKATNSVGFTNDQHSQYDKAEAAALPSGWTSST